MQIWHSELLIAYWLVISSVSGQIQQEISKTLSLLLFLHASGQTASNISRRERLLKLSSGVSLSLFQAVLFIWGPLSWVARREPSWMRGAAFEAERGAHGHLTNEIYWPIQIQPSRGFRWPHTALCCENCCWTRRQHSKGRSWLVPGIWSLYGVKTRNYWHIW